MDGLRSAALSVFLDHSLSAAITARADLEQRQVHKATTEAAELWVKFCRNAQSLCGVFGLIAIDRAEEQLRHSLTHEVSFRTDEKKRCEDAAVIRYQSARSYARALAAKHRGDHTSEKLWNYAGAICDYVISTENSNTLDGRIGPPDWQDELRSFKARYCTAEYLNNAELAGLVALVLQAYDTANAMREIGTICCQCRRAFAVNNVNYWIAQWNGAKRMANSNRNLIKAIDYTQLAQKYATEGVEALHCLWRACASQLRTAAQLRVADDDNAYVIEGRVEPLATTGGRVGQLLEAIKQAASGPRGDVRVLNPQVDAIFGLLKEACESSDPAATLSAINELAAAAEAKLRVLLRVQSSEEVAADRYTAQAERVDTSRSEAHFHIKQCWERAAEQMRLAIDAGAAQEQQLHKHRSALLEKLALGPFTTAAGYFAKADRAATVQAAELWREAGQMILQATTPVIERCLSVQEIRRNPVLYSRDEGALAWEAALWADQADSHQRAIAAGPCDASVRALYEAEYRLHQAITSASFPSTLYATCKSVISICAHLHLLTHSLPLPIYPANPTTPPGSASSHSPDEERSARVERLTYLCDILRDFMQYHRDTLSNSSKVQASIAKHALRLLRVVEARAFDTIQAWNSKFGPYAPRHYLYSLQSVLEPLKENRIDQAFSGIAAARFLSTCTTSGDIYNQYVQGEIYRRLLQQTGAIDISDGAAMELPQQPTALQGITEGGAVAQLDSVVTILTNAARQCYSHRRLRKLPRPPKKTKVKESNHSLAAEQDSRAAMYLQLSILTTLKSVSDPSLAASMDEDTDAADSPTATIASTSNAAEAQTCAAKGNRALRSARCFANGDSYYNAGRYLWEAPPPGMKAGPSGSMRRFTDAQRPIADLAAERYIQAVKCTVGQLKDRWHTAAWHTACAIAEYGCTDRKRAVALAKADAEIAKIPAQHQLGTEEGCDVVEVGADGLEGAECLGESDCGDSDYWEEEDSEEED